MKEQDFFTIQSLLYDTENLQGPITQVLFAQKFADFVGMEHPNQLARVEFKNADVHKAFPGTKPLDETLIIGHADIDECTQHLCIRSKNSGVQVATGHYPTRTVTVHEEYHEIIIPAKLSDKAIETIFNYVWNNPLVLLPIPPPADLD